MAQLKITGRESKGTEFVNPDRCLNYEGGHHYEHKLVANISSAIDPISGEMPLDATKEVCLDLVCRHCASRVRLHTKTVGLAETVTMAQMLAEHKANLAAAYYAKQQETQEAPSMGGR